MIRPTANDMDCRVIARLVAEAFGARAAGVHLVRDGAVVVLGRHGFPPPAPDDVPRTPPCLDVARGGEGLVIRDLRLLGLGFYAGVPIVVDGEVVGALCILHDRPVRGTVDVLPLLAQVAAQVATVLQDGALPADAFYAVMTTVSRSGLQHCW